MLRLLKFHLALVLVGGIVGLGGFLAFADSVRNLAPDPQIRGDGIVVLTGDEDRISTGMLLLETGKASRMLISGVHPTTRIPTELKRHIRDSEALVRCCVDIGRAAVNTSGNAEEAQSWVAGRGFRSLIVVTSSYHMPRSLAEFRRAMPGMTLVGYPVVKHRHLRLQGWWTHGPTTRLLFAEYVKFLGATVRLGWSRLLMDARRQLREPAQPLPAETARTVGAAR